MNTLYALLTLFLMKNCCYPQKTLYKCDCDKNYIENKMLVNDYKKYLGKPVYEFLLDTNIKCFAKLAYMTEPPGRFRYISVWLCPRLKIEIRLDSLKFLRPFGEPIFAFDKSALYKEQISRLDFIYDGVPVIIIGKIPPIIEKKMAQTPQGFIEIGRDTIYRKERLWKDRHNDK